MGPLKSWILTKDASAHHLPKLYLQRCTRSRFCCIQVPAKHPAEAM